jgi:hypothetical protein
VAVADLPAAVQAGLAQLAADDVYFAPVRHHSPACALALRALIREVKPAAVLVEGPDDFDALIPLLLDPATRPPVAILAQARPDAQSSVRSMFYPFCDYSPEWVALHEGRAAGAQLAFIDLPWHAAPAAEDDDMRSLMSERYLAHSAYVKALAANSGCRDQDELWDHLFELRPPAALLDWRTLFADVFCYCAMARADYEPAVLEAEGSLPRERHMAQHLRAWRTKVSGPIVVVTGGFHTIALQQMLAVPQASAPAPPSTAIGNWLLRYSFDQLDALNGYAAGMPSPAYYQRIWDSDGPDWQAVAIDCLVALARRSRHLGLADQLSTADVQAATVQAVRLADLRGHAGPGRQDLLDAVRSCFIKGAVDDGTRGAAADLRRLLGGSRIGDIPASAGSPPLLEDARRIAASLRVNLDDSQPRTMRLDIYRKDRHRARSRFLHLMSWLGTGLGRWQSGPDFVGGSSLDVLTEEWQVGWNPLVEARLVALSALGPTLLDVAMARLRQEQAALEQDGGARSASNAVALLTRACLVGLHARLPALLELVAAQLEEDANAASVITCGHRLLLLWRGREPLGLQDHPQLAGLMQRAWRSALYLLPQLADAGPDNEAPAIDSLLALRALHDAQGSADTGAWRAQLQAIATSQAAAPGVAGAAAALLFVDGEWDEAQLAQRMQRVFGPGATAADAVRALRGLMAAAPELLLTQARLRDDFSAIMAGWDEATFIVYLPDLRHAFALLKPRETAQLAAALAGPDAGVTLLAPTHDTVTASAMLAGTALQAALAAYLARDGLADWTRT